MSRFPKLSTGLHREFRNSYNQGVEKVDEELDLQKQRVDRLITENPQPSEVVDARGNHPVLGDRINSVESHLAQTETEVRRSQSIVTNGKRQAKPIVTFVLDDATTTDYNMLSIAQEKNFPFGIAVITSKVGEQYYMTWEQIHEFEDTGLVEIMSHTHNHQDMTKLSLSEMDNDLQTNVSLLKSNGFNVNSFVYPYNSHNDNTISVVRRYFEFAFARTYGDTKGNNYPTINNQAIDRVSLGSYEDGATPGYPSDTLSLEYYKARVDNAVANNGWLVFVLHSAVTNSEQWQHVRDVVDYIRSLGVDIVKPTDGFDIQGNIVQTGSFSNGFIVDRDGNELKRQKHFVESSANPYTSTDLWTAFPENAITTFHVNSNGSTGFPDNAGVVTTYKVGTQYGYYRQEFRNYLRDEIWFRRPKNDGSDWGPWIKENPLVVDSNINAYSASTLISSYPRNSVTTFHVNAQSESGWPESAAGVVSVYRIGSQNGYYRQEFRKYQSDYIWVRLANGDGSWGEWTLLNPNIVRKSANPYLSTTPIISFLPNTTTTFFVTASSQSGWPDSGAGIVTTYRIGSQNGFYRQEFRKYQSNQSWSRWVNNDGTWTAWEKISVV